MTRPLAMLLCLVPLLSARAIGKPIPEATTYVIDPPPPPPAASGRPETLRMGKVRAAPTFAGKSLVVRMDEVRYTADFYNAFIAPPGDMLGTVIARWLNQAGPFSAVTQPETRTPSTHVLEANVIELYGDFRPGRPPRAVMQIQFSLVDLTGIGPKVKLQRSIARSVPLANSTPEALTKGYGQALGEILAELVEALRTGG